MSVTHIGARSCFQRALYQPCIQGPGNEAGLSRGAEAEFTSGISEDTIKPSVIQISSISRDEFSL